MSMQRSLKAFLLLALAFVLALPTQALATQAEVPEYGVTVAFPPSLDVLTRTMPESDPVLNLYGLSASQARQQLESQGLYALAYDIAGEFQVTLTLSGNGGADYGAMDTAGLMEAARAYGGSQYELLAHSQGSFLLVPADNGRNLACVFQAEGLLMELRLIAGTRISRDMVSLLKGIAMRTSFSLGQ